MFGRLFLALTLVTLIELFILVKLAGLISVGWTVALVLLTGFVGAGMAKREGFRVLQELQEVSQRGEMPTRQIVDGVTVLVAGIFLLTPGVLTDVVGFALLVPQLRAPLNEKLRRTFRDMANATRVNFVQVRTGTWGAANPRRPGSGRPEDVVIDAEVIKRKPGGSRESARQQPTIDVDYEG